MLIYAIESKQNYELIQGILNLFLNEHSLKLLESENLKESLNKLFEIQEINMKFLEDDYSHILSMIQLINKIKKIIFLFFFLLF